MNYKKSKKVTLVSSFLLKLMKGCHIMMHNSYFAFVYQPYSVLLILSAIRLMWVRLCLFWPKKNLLTNCLSKAGIDFLSRCLSMFDHGKILEIQVPLSNFDPLSTCCSGLFDKIFVPFVYLEHFPCINDTVF